MQYKSNMFYLGNEESFTAWRERICMERARRENLRSGGRVNCQKPVVKESVNFLLLFVSWSRVAQLELKQCPDQALTARLRDKTLGSFL